MSINVAAQKAAGLLGGQSSMAAICEVSPQAVSQWIKGVRPIPEKRCVVIERATHGAISRRDLRPDDWREIWPELAADDLQGVAHA